jgi:guanylate kinase
MIGPLIIVSGPAGGGKTTVVREALKVCSRPIRVAITATTRAPRAGEVDGRDYHFWSREKFLAEIAAGSFLEHAIVHESDYYGTPRAEVGPFRQQGMGVILIIDVQGAEQVRRQHPEAFSVFLQAPGDDYRSRLEQRGDSPENVQRRLDSAAKELTRKNEYSVQLVNDRLDETVQALCRIIGDRFNYAEGNNRCSTT